MDEIDRLAQIVDELLVLSRAGEHELPGEEVELGDAAHAAAERWRAGGGRARDRDPGRRRGRRGERLDRRPRPRPRDRRPGRERAPLLARRARPSRWRAGAGAIEIDDEGPGLAPGEEEAVFERFSRGSAGRSGPGGTGLGLPIARELTRQWGGEIELANRDRGGLRATIEVPADGAAVSRLPCAGSAWPWPGSSSRSAVAILAANLASRQIGLASEPISAGDQLAPASSPATTAKEAEARAPPPPKRPKRPPNPAAPLPPPGPNRRRAPRPPKAKNARATTTAAGAGANGPTAGAHTATTEGSPLSRRRSAAPRRRRRWHG